MFYRVSFVTLVSILVFVWIWNGEPRFKYMLEQKERGTWCFHFHQSFIVKELGFGAHPLLLNSDPTLYLMHNAKLIK